MSGFCKSQKGRSSPSLHAMNQALSVVLAQGMADLDARKRAFGSSLSFTGAKHMVHYLTKLMRMYER